VGGGGGYIIEQISHKMSCLFIFVCDLNLQYPGAMYASTDNDLGPIKLC
jgi:hypothetical protein